MPEPISDENIRPRINRQRRRLYDPIVADPEAPKTRLPGQKPEPDKQRRRLYDPIVADPEALQNAITRPEARTRQPALRHSVGSRNTY